jgi:hypothetical protein
MVEQEVVDASRSGDVVAAACSVWAVSPKEAVRTIKGGFSNLNLDQIVDLSTSIEWEADDNATLISQVYAAISEHVSDDTKEQVVTGILNNGLTGTDSHPDYALELWISALGDDKKAILESSILSTDVDDSQKSRLWSQLLAYDETTEPEYLIVLIQKLALIPNGESTANTILGGVDRLRDLLQTTDYQSALARDLMSQFTAYPSKTIKTAVARASKGLAGDASLSHLDDTDLSDTDVAILKSVYSDSRAIKKYEKLLKHKE